MALGDSYATLDDLKDQFKIGDQEDDAALADALATASREIDRHCERQFNLTTDATARLYRPKWGHLATVDDFHTTAGLVIETDAGGTGTFSTTWTAVDYELNPLNGIVGSEAGWPFSRIRAMGGHRFPVGGRAGLRVTAQWGWAEIPTPVKRACLIIASETFKVKDAPFGALGMGDYGMVRVKNSPIAMRMLAPYRVRAARIG